jgi:hypothetical protein
MFPRSWRIVERLLMRYKPHTKVISRQLKTLSLSKGCAEVVWGLEYGY